jgi:transcriptional regulator with XRE-family HTH domain
MKIGELIKHWRTVEHKSLRDLAPEIGTSVATLSRVERGELMDGHTLAKIFLWMTTK